MCRKKSENMNERTRRRKRSKEKRVCIKRKRIDFFFRVWLSHGMCTVIRLSLQAEKKVNESKKKRSEPKIARVKWFLNALKIDFLWINLIFRIPFSIVDAHPKYNSTLERDTMKLFEFCIIFTWFAFEIYNRQIHERSKEEKREIRIIMFTDNFNCRSIKIKFDNKLFNGLLLRRYIDGK